MNYYPPNCKATFNGFHFDVSFIIHCEGLTTADGSRWTTMGAERRDRIINALEFLGWLYEPRYSPKWEGDRLVFDALEIKYQGFKRRWNNLPWSVFERFDREVGYEAFSISPKSTFCEIWDAFYRDVARTDVYDFFMSQLDKIKDDDDEDSDQ